MTATTEPQLRLPGLLDIPGPEGGRLRLAAAATRRRTPLVGAVPVSLEKR